MAESLGQLRQLKTLLLARFLLLPRIRRLSCRCRCRLRSRGRLRCPLAILFVRLVPADGATGSGTEDSVAAGHMPSNATDGGALQTAFGAGGTTGDGETKNGDGEEWGAHGCS